MGKKRAAAVGAAAPVFPFRTAAAGDPDHFGDYGFDPQLVRFFAQPEGKRPSTSASTRRRQHQPPTALAPLESARFKLQKPVSITKKQHHGHKQQRRGRRWWSAAASAALLLFRRQSASTNAVSPAAEAPAAPPYYGSASPTALPLYLADGDGDDGGPGACACCWAPAMWSGRLAAAELGAAAVAAVPYVSLRSTGLGAGAGVAAAAPAMPIYLVT